MGQTLRSQVYNQMTQDVNNTINSAVNAMDSLSQLKQTYDYSYQKQIEGEAQRANEERQEKIKKTNDVKEWDAADKEYFDHMSSYIDQINAPQTVKNKWNNEFVPTYKAQFKNQRATDEARLMATDSQRLWNEKREEIGSKDISLAEKEKELQEYWDDTPALGSSLTERFVGHVTTVKEALEEMRLPTAYQQGVKEYANQSNSPYVDYNKIVSASLNGIEFKNEMEKQEVINKVISDVVSSEKTAQILADSKTDEITRKYNSYLASSVEGFSRGKVPEYGYEQILIDLENAGAWNDDRTINRHYESFVMTTLEGYQLEKANENAVAEIEKAGGFTLEDVVTAATGSDLPEQYVSYEGLTPVQLINARRSGEDLVPVSERSYNYVGLALLENGELNYELNYGKKTYKYNNESVTVEHSPVVDALCKEKGFETEAGIFSAAKAVAYAEENTGVFSNPDQVAKATMLKAQQFNDPYNYATYVYEAMSSGVFTAEELKSYDLWDTEWDNLLQKEPYKDWASGEGTGGDLIATRVKGKIFNVNPGKNGYLSNVKTKFEKANDVELTMYRELYQSTKSQFVSWLASNPGASISEMDEKLNEILTDQTKAVIDSSVEKALAEPVTIMAEADLFNSDRPVNSTLVLDTKSTSLRELSNSLNGGILLKPIVMVNDLFGSIGSVGAAAAGYIAGGKEEAEKAMNEFKTASDSFGSKPGFPTLRTVKYGVADMPGAQDLMRRYFHNETFSSDTPVKNYVIPDFVAIAENIPDGKTPEESYDLMLKGVSNNFGIKEAWTYDNTDEDVHACLAMSLMYAKYRQSFVSSVVDTFNLDPKEGYQVVEIDNVGFACITRDGRCYMQDDNPSTSRSWVIGKVSDNKVSEVFDSKGTTKLQPENISGYYSFKLGFTDARGGYALGQEPTDSTQRRLAEIYSNLGFDNLETNRKKEATRKKETENAKREVYKEKLRELGVEVDNERYRAPSTQELINTIK